MQMMTGACVKFGGVNLYRTKNIEKMGQIIEANRIPEMCVQLGRRQLGPTHELVELTGKDIFTFYEKTMDIEFPDTLKALPAEEAFTQLETNPELAPIRGKMDQFHEAMSTGEMFDIAPALTMTTAFFEYLGFCQGKGQTADGTPVNVINLDA
jgi:hypothetical protein